MFPALLAGIAGALPGVLPAAPPRPATSAGSDAASAKGQPVPSAILPLERFGYRPGGNAFTVRAGYTGATVHFIDAEHLLLTFSARKLMKRLPEQRENDDDHTIRAEVVHIPDGRVVRETEWRMHDRAPYLWSLGNGHFLLRERGSLFSLDPMGGFDAGELGRRLLVQSEQEIVALQVSPGGDLLMMETTPPAKIGDDPDEKRPTQVAASFYKISLESTGAVRLASRGRAVSKDAFSLAFTSTGVLQTVKEDRTHWGFDFHAYDGKNMQLAGFTSTCRPRSIFVSDAEFFAYGCRGGEERRLMGGFNLLGDAKWVFTLDESPLWLAVDTAPENGRFAVRNTITSISAGESDRLGSDDIRAQEIRVYGSREGEELLRVICSPAQRPSGNFAIAPDGLQLAVLHGTNIELYRLPPISTADRKLHEREQAALAPLRPAAEVNVAASLAGAPDDRPQDPQ